VTSITEVLKESATEVFITGFPRSGNTWLNRIVCDLLDAPLQNIPSEELDYSRTKTHGTDYVVRKTHWYRYEYDELENGYYGRPTKVVWISRDPRDMIVSMMHYRSTDQVQPIIKTIETPEWPKRGFRKFIKGWLEHPPDYHITYEDLHRDPVNHLAWMYEAVTGRFVSAKIIEEVVERQQFKKLKHLDPHSMHKGVVGDWKNHFTYDAAIEMEKKYSEILRTLGYTTDPNWVEEILK
jgi:hypothetical protein